jgi:hypothetical protein
MLITYFFVGMAFAIPELILVYNWPALKRFIEKNPIIELVFSLMLSVALAKVMGIGFGVTLAVANVFSTAITLAFYHWKVKERFDSTVNSVRTTKAAVKKTANEFSEIIHTLNIIIVGPFRLFARLCRQLNAYIAWLSAWRAKRAI